MKTKKTVVLFLTVALLFSLCACGSAGGETVAESEEQSENAASEGKNESSGKTENNSGNEDPESLKGRNNAKDTDIQTSYVAESYSAVYAEMVRFSNSQSEDNVVYSGSVAAAAPIEEAAADTVATAEVTTESNAGGYGGSSGSDYSGTNVQTAGVDECDVVKTDGENIYMLNNGELTILKAAGEQTEVLSRTEISVNDYTDGENNEYESRYKYPENLYIYEDTLAVLCTDYYYHYYSDDSGEHYENHDAYIVDLYDISNPYAPTLSSSVGCDGYNTDSRLMDGVLYIINTWYPNTGDFDEADVDTYVPSLYKNGIAETIPAQSIRILPNRDENCYMIVCSYDLTGGDECSSVALLGRGNTVYMTTDTLYVAGTSYVTTESEPYTESVYTVTDYASSASTSIYSFNLKDGIEFISGTVIPGYLNDQFSMDEWNGILRVVTTDNSYSYSIYYDEEYDFTNRIYKENEDDANSLFLLDENLNITGKIEDLAAGEYIYSARYDEEMAYFCTYRTIDPLFAVDCSDPENPVVKSELEITGFSQYLHVWSDDLLFGFGCETDEENGWTEGLKLVMFDTSAPLNVQPVDIEWLYDENYSEALYNHKAFFIDVHDGLLGFSGNQSYYLYHYSETEGFTQFAVVTFDDWAWNIRGFYIDEYIYVVSTAGIHVLSRESGEELAEISLAVG